MIVQVSIRRSDTCGNTDYELYGFYNTSSIEKAKEIFKESPFAGFLVEEIIVKELPLLPQKIPREYR